MVLEGRWCVVCFTCLSLVTWRPVTVFCCAAVLELDRATENCSRVAPQCNDSISYREPPPPLGPTVNIVNTALCLKLRQPLILLWSDEPFPQPSLSPTHTSNLTIASDKDI